MTTDIHALAGAYVLDAVSDIERAAFTRHLSECESCAVEVDELREAAARLADGAWSVPPPRLRTQVLEQVRRTRQLPPGGSRSERDVAAAVSRWRRVTAAAAVAGILATGAGAATYAVQEQRVREQRNVAAALRAESERVRAVLAAPDVKVRTAAVTGGGRVTVATSANLDTGVVLLDDAAPPGPDRAYQLWLMDGPKGHSEGVLAVGQTTATRLISGLQGMETFGLSVEPAGGSPEPTLATATTVPLA